MPRRPQIAHPGVVYHVISRFVAREWFIRTPEERRTYLQLFAMAISQSDWRCLSFAVMSSHVHHALEAGRDPLAAWLRQAHGPFAEWTNERRGRIGAVFTRGPKLLAVRPDGIAPLIAYIHRNPVRAGVVPGPGDTDWTSHNAYARRVTQPAWLDVGRGVELAGFDCGPALAGWVEQTEVTRAQLEAVLVHPPRRVRSAPGEEAALLEAQAVEDLVDARW